MIPSTFIRRASIIAAAVVLFGTRTQAAELVFNGGFEGSNPNHVPGGFPPGWTDNDPTPGGPFSGVDNTNGLQHSGNQYAFLGAQNTVGTLSQTLNTVIGQAYTLSFWLANDGDGSSVETFSFMFGTLAAVPINLAPNGGTFGPYTQFVFTNLIASSASTVLKFQYQHNDSFYRLDDVSVQGPAGAPESGTTLLLALPALLTLCVFHFRGARVRGLRS